MRSSRLSHSQLQTAILLSLQVQSWTHLAGTPAQSNTTSAPLPSLNSNATFLRSSLNGLTTFVAPNSVAKFCRDVVTSDTIIVLTPFAFRHRIAAKPIGPPPNTTVTLSELISGAAVMACHETDKGSTRAPISSVKFSGNGKTCVARTQTASLRPPPPPLNPTKPPVWHAF